MVPGEKGRALERAVHAIEAVILKSSPALREKAFRIEMRKQLNVGGVHHEIDIFVTVEIAKGYNATFIFECKNWAAPVGKKEIIVFAEKIDAAVAQHGYVIATSFTKDAVAQAEKDPRIMLLTATEHDPALTAPPDGFHYTTPASVKAVITFRAAGSAGTNMTTTGVDGKIVHLYGTDVPLTTNLETWTRDLYERRLLGLWTADLPEGIHPMTAWDERSFGAGECLMEGKEMALARLDADYGVNILRPAVISDYEVSTRGRVIRLAPITVRDIAIDTAFVTLQD